MIFANDRNDSLLLIPPKECIRVSIAIFTVWSKRERWERMEYAFNCADWLRNQREETQSPSLIDWSFNIIAHYEKPMINCRLWHKLNSRVRWRCARSFLRLTFTTSPESSSPYHSYYCFTSIVEKAEAHILIARLSANHHAHFSIPACSLCNLLILSMPRQSCQRTTSLTISGISI